MPMYFGPREVLEGNPFTLHPGEGMGGETVSVDEWGFNEGPGSQLTFSAQGGRVNVLPGDVEAVSAGILVPRPDGTKTLDLRDVEGDRVAGAVLTATLDDGKTASVNVSPISHWGGYAKGNYYYLPKDANDRFVFEPGQRHRKIYVGGSPSALTRAQIAADAGVSESTVTGSWLENRLQYGGTEGTAISYAVFALLYAHLYGQNKNPRSDHIRFERGYEYPFKISANYVAGEDELHPLVFADWGAGAYPIIVGLGHTNRGPRYIAIQNMQMDELGYKGSYGLILDHVDMYDRQVRGNYFQLNGSYFTLHESSVRENRRTTPSDPTRTTWDGSPSRTSGLYMSGTRDIMLDAVALWYNGWREGYDTGNPPSAALPQPPHALGHGGYFQFNTDDITMRDSYAAQNSGSNVQIRGGGNLYGCVQLDGNAGLGVFGTGSSNSTPPPAGQGQLNFVVVQDNVIMSAGKRDSALESAVDWGMALQGFLQTAKNCIVAHRADPNNAAEIAEKGSGGTTVSVMGWDTPGKYIVDDTIVCGWNALPNRNMEGVDLAVANQTTGQNFIRDLLDDPTADLWTFSEHIVDQSTSIREVVQAFNVYAHEGFNRPYPTRSAATDVAFIPNPETDGFRGDNRLNWSTGDIPGVQFADRVDLGGNRVTFGGVTAVYAECAGASALRIPNGKLTVNQFTGPANVAVSGSGQLVVGATTQPVSVHATRGRVTVQNGVTDLDLKASGRAQVLLPAALTIPAGNRMEISGLRPRVGWDGTGTASLTIAGGAELAFHAGIRAAVRGTDLIPNTSSGQDDIRLDLAVSGSLSGATGFIADYESRSSTDQRLWLDDLSAMPAENDVIGYGYYSDDVVNYVRTFRTTPLLSFPERGFAQILRFRSGSIGDGMTEPTVTPTITLASGSAVVIEGRDLLLPGTYDLTGPGVTVVNNGATLPAGVAVVGGVLRLTVS